MSLRNMSLTASHPTNRKRRFFLIGLGFLALLGLTVIAIKLGSRGAEGPDERLALHAELSDDSHSRPSLPGDSLEEAFLSIEEASSTANFISGAEAIRSFARLADSAYTANERARWLLKLAEHRPFDAAAQARDLRDVFCNPVHIAAARQVRTPEDVIADRESYCEGLDHELIESVLELAAHDDLLDEDPSIDKIISRHPAAATQYALDHALMSVSEERRSEKFTALVTQVETLDELLTLLTTNNAHASKNHGASLWRLGSELQADQFALADLAKAQTVALSLYGCQLFGGCADKQIVRISWCGMSMFGGACPPGTSLEELWYLTTSPVDWALAQEILRLLSQP